MLLVKLLGLLLALPLMFVSFCLGWLWQAVVIGFQGGMAAQEQNAEAGLRRMREEEAKRVRQ